MGIYPKAPSAGIVRRGDEPRETRERVEAMVVDLDSQREIEALLTKAESVLRNASYNYVAVCCGNTLEAALQHLITQRAPTAEIRRRELGLLIGQTRELGLCPEACSFLLSCGTMKCGGCELT